MIFLGLHSMRLLFLNQLGLETNLVYFVNNLIRADLVGIEIDCPLAFKKTNARLFNTFQPLQGFFYDQWACRSGHTFDLKYELIGDSQASSGNHQHCERYYK